MEKKKVLVGLSWPYANSRLHIGNVASSLPADAIARYHRMIGNRVSFVTGSDCYGTPITVRASKEGLTPTEIAEKYHAHHAADFKAFDFSFDNYDKTLSARHHKFVREFHEQMYKGDMVYEKAAPQFYCDKCKKFLPDRYVEGICPHCKKASKGDSCDSCGKILEPEELLSPKCITCNGTPVAKDQTQLYIKFSSMQKAIEKYYKERCDKWTTNAVGLTGRYLNEGLRDRAITRSIEWGIDVPKKGFEDKRIYIWAENVLGYLSASEPEFFSKQSKDNLHYYVHGKDNIPFHAIILPGLIMAHGGGYHLPDMIVANEYVTICGDKISKSKGNFISAHTLHENLDVDMVRYFFLRVMNDKRDTNFTAEDFVNTINGELVNNFGNLVNRTLSFVATKFDRVIPKSTNDKVVLGEIKNIKTQYNDLMMLGRTSLALKVVMDLVNFGNKYFADNKPWTLVGDVPTADLKKAQAVIGNVVSIILECTVMLSPFIPRGTAKVLSWIGGDKLGDIEVLYQRLDLKDIKEKLKI